ncbi:hypothetical protein N0V82_006736 [Gnomoniopsis sp. IMI 355080]|nr:hypothetical protein N0V82_006736 [Gnomoniopsis sp. IMI 355080]
MARETSPTTSANGDAAAEPARPGTSGTEMLLVNNRRRASHRLKEASRKERDYKTKKRSASARANYNEAGLHHNWAGAKLTWGVIASAGYLFRDKNDKLKRESEEKRKLRALEKQRKLEEKQRREKELLEKAETGTLAEPAAAAAAEE